MGVGKLRCSIVGLGRIGSLLEGDRLREKPCTHAGAIARNRDCVLAAGCDIDAERRALFSDRWRCRQVYPGIEEMLREVPTDILHVATPPRTHRELIERALAFGVKVIVCEKPLAERSADAKQIAEFHRSGKVKILTNHERRYSVDYRKVKRHIARGTYGGLLSIASRLYMGEHGDVFDVLLDDGTHLVDIVQFLTDSSLVETKTKLDRNGNAHTLSILARADDVRERHVRARRIPVFMEVGTGRDHVVFELDLSFASGRIRIGNGLYEEYRSDRSPFYEGVNSLIKGRAKRPPVTGYFSNMLQDAVMCAREEGHFPLSSALDGFSAFLFIDSVKRHFRNRGD